ncbi:RHS repeat-associated core domain-containing protein [Candidatus Peregrinibacteria bacterium]|nr:MAG: RHS repeat-associated core domain-containing protein [Candidatus Peregrinibacteria bacterium]
MGNRSQLIEQIGNQAQQTTLYTYDSLGELELVNNTSNGQNPAMSAGDILYAYANGNRVEMSNLAGLTTYTYGNGNRLTQASKVNGLQTVDYTYNGNGSLISESYSRMGLVTRSTNYEYDQEGNLRRVRNSWQAELPYGAHQQQPTYYLYDYMGNRTMKLSGVDSATNYTYYVNEGHRVINELKEGGSSGTAGSPYRVDKSIVYGIDQIAQIDENGVIEYVHTDPIGSTLVMTDASGNDIKQMEYAPFGEVMGASGPGDTKYQFTGQEYDPESELVYMNARYYSPSLGRFIQKDPVVGYEGNALSWNPYVYANNNPLRYNDPTGEFLHIIAGALGGAVIGVAGQLVGDLLSGNGFEIENYIGAAVGGAVTGAIIAGTGNVPLGIVAGSAAENATTQVSKIISKKQEKFDTTEFLVDTGVQSTVGLITSGIKIPINKINTGQGSFTAVSKQITTKFLNGNIKSISSKTAAKITTAVIINDLPGAIVGAGIMKGINQISDNK